MTKMAKTALKDRLDEVHYIAEKFLQDHLAKEANTYTCENLEKTASQAVIIRDRIPEYFCALKQNGQPIWSHDKRFAKYLNIHDTEVWLDSLARKGFTVRAEVQE